MTARCGKPPGGGWDARRHALWWKLRAHLVACLRPSWGVLALIGTVTGYFNVASVCAGSVSSTGSLQISADDVVAGNFVAMTGTAEISEDGAPEWGDGTTIIIEPPTGFRFDTGASITATVTGGDIALQAPTTKNPNNAFTIMFFVQGAHAAASTISFTGITLQQDDTSCNPGGQVGDRSDIKVSTSAGAPALTDAALIDVEVVPGAAYELEFTASPANKMAGEDLLPVVTILDQCGNTVTGDDRTITLAIQANPGGAALNGDLDINTVAGVATWTDPDNLNIIKPGTGYTLRASHSGAAFTGSDTVDSAAFDITPNVPHVLEFTTEPGHTDAGEDLLPVVTIKDVHGNVVTNDDRTITLSLQTDPVGTTLNGDVDINTVSGVATWAGGHNLNITEVGTGFQLRATGSGVFAGSDVVDSALFNITPNVPHELVFTTEPTTSTAGVALTPEITILDVHGNVVTDDDRTITLSFAANPGGGALLGDVDINTVSGVATWGGPENLRIEVAAAGYRLRATGSGGFTGSTTEDSALFDIDPEATYDHLAFTAQPMTTTAGVALVPQLTIQDQFDNTITSAAVETVTLTLLNGGGATLLGDLDLTTTNGVATWVGGDNLRIEETGVGYQLRASCTGVFTDSGTVDSNAFNIVSAAPDTIEFSVQPATSTAGVVLTPEVTIRDEFNNVVTNDDRTITLALLNGGGATLLGDIDLVTSSGVATWAGGQNLRVEQSGSGYQLRATGSGAYGTSGQVDSAAFDIDHDVADHLVFSTDPVNTTAGVALVPEVTIQDQFNNTVEDDDRTITLTLLNGGGATLLGDVDIATVNGVATWTGGEAMNIEEAGTGYQLRASHDGAGFTGSDTVDSAAFDITHDVADMVEFTAQPVTTGAGLDLLPAVRMLDQFGNTVSTGGARTVTLTIENNPGGATLNGDVDVDTVNGVATWLDGHNLNITTMSVGYTLRATCSGAFTTSDTIVSAGFDITVGQAHHLEFSTQPVNTVAGVALVPAVSIKDEYGNTVTTDDRTITLTLLNGGGATLLGDVDIATVNGVATWTGGEAMNIEEAGTGYQLRASHDGAGFTGSDTVDSAAFDITHDVADHLVFSTDPVNTTAGVALVPEVTIQDQFNNTVEDDDRTITLTLLNGGGATLLGDVDIATVNGVATWTGGEAMNIEEAGTGYQLRASHDGAGFTGSDTVDSAAFDITHDVADHLVFSTDPVNTTAGVALVPEVTIQDQFNNTVEDDDRTITLTLLNGGGATLLGDVDIATVNGVATWTGGEAMNIEEAGTGYQLRASHDGAGFTGSDTVDSAAFDITHDVADHLVFSTDPVNTTAGVALVPEVTIQDQFNNTVEDDDRTITLTLLNGGGATLLGDVDIATVNGVATWTGGEAMNIEEAGTGYQLRASHDGAGFTGSDTVDSAAFDITHDVADHLVFSTDPVNTTAGVALVPEVTIQDQFNNTVEDDDRTITLTLLNGGGATLLGDVDIATVNGVATWTGGEAMNIEEAGTGYQLRASHDGAGFTGSDTVDSVAFDITAETTADHLDFTVEPVDTAAGADLLVEVSVKDQFDNIVTAGAPRNITLSLVVNPSGATLNGDNEIATVNGVATWTVVEALNITVTDIGYQLRANGSGGYTTSGQVDSALFDITPAAANHMVFSTQPSSSVAGADLLPEITIRDEYDNVVTGDDRTITLTLLNAGGASLLGDVDIATVNGVATWLGAHDLRIEQVGIGYQLQAAHDGAPFTGAGAADTVDSAAFNIGTSVPHHLAFTVQPATLNAGVPLVPQVTIQDEFDNTIASDDRTITLTLLNAGGATLLGDIDIPTVSGVATWNAGHDLNIELVGSGYQLRATHDGGAFAGSDTVDSVAFDVTPNALDHFDATPSAATVNVNTAVRITITARDQHDNAKPGFVTTDDIVISTDTGGDATTIDFDDGGLIAGFVDGGLTATIPAGTAFDGSGELWVDVTNRRAEAITITVSDGVVTDGTANVTWNAEATLDNFLLEAAPGACIANTASTLTITARDQFDNPIPGYTTVDAITVSTDTAGDGTNLDYDDAGAIAGFADLGATATIPIGTACDGAGQLSVDIINRLAETITITVSDGTATDGTTNVTWDPAVPLLLHIDAVGSPVAGAPFNVTVNVTDQYDNPSEVTQDTGVTLSVHTGSDVLGGTTTGTIGVGTSSAIIGPMTYNTAEPGVVLLVERTSGDFLVSGTSAAFTVTGGAPDRLVFDPPSFGNQVAGTPFDVTVIPVDVNGNPTTIAGGADVELSIFAGTPGSLAGTTTGTIAPGGGSVTIVGVEYTTAESGVKLRVDATSGPALTHDVSDAFTVNPGVATQLQIENINTQVADAAFSVVVNVLDAHGNLAGVEGPGDTDIELSRVDGTGTLSGTLVKTLTPGQSSATFSVSYDTAEPVVSIRADVTAGPALTAALSNQFVVNSSQPERLDIDVIASPQIAGAPFDVLVKAVDSVNNEANVSGDTDVVLSLNTGSGTLARVGGLPLTETILDGTSSVLITDVIYDVAETGVGLTATATSGGDGLSPDDSNLFEVMAANGAALRFVQQPTNTDVTTPLEVSVEIIDAYGNRAAATDVVSLTLVDGGGCGGALVGTTSRAAINGLAQFAAAEDVRVSRVCSGYRIKASAVGLGTVTSNAFNVSAGTDLTGGVTSLSVDDGTAVLSVTYTITGSQTVPAFMIGYGLDRNTSDSDPLDTLLDVVDVTSATLRSPGTHTITLGDIRSDLDEVAVEHGMRAATWLDYDSEITETNEDDNVATASLGVDLAIQSVSADLRDNGSSARVVYAVNSPANVPAFTVIIGCDRSGDDVMDEVVAEVTMEAGDLTPGPHVLTVPLDEAVLLANVVNQQEVVLVAILDANDTVAESNETTNNTGSTTEAGYADVEVTLVDEPDYYEIGQELSTVWRVTNVGIAEARELTLTVPVPQNAEFVRAEYVGGREAGYELPNARVLLNAVVEVDVVRIDVGTLTAAEAADVSVVFRPLQGGPISLSVVAESLSADATSWVTLGRSTATQIESFDDLVEELPDHQSYSDEEIYEEVTTTVRYTGFCGGAGLVSLGATLLGLLGLRVRCGQLGHRRDAPRRR